MKFDVLLIQGGLGNQLLQTSLFSRALKLPLKDVAVSDNILTSRLRSFRGVTPRSISPLLQPLVCTTDPLSSYWVRCANRMYFLGYPLFDGSLKRCKVFSRNLYIGDGISRAAFHPDNALFWISILNSLDAMYGSINHCNVDIAIHARRSDFFSKKFQKVTGLYPLPTEYYLKALGILSESASQRNNISVFTDSIDYASCEFARCSLPLRIQPASSPEFDLWSLSWAKSLILSNSTFSCVAAHLAALRNPKVNIICPRAWFNHDKFNNSRADLRLPTWSQI